MKIESSLEYQTHPYVRNERLVDVQITGVLHIETLERAVALDITNRIHTAIERIIEEYRGEVTQRNRQEHEKEQQRARKAEIDWEGAAQAIRDGAYGTTPPVEVPPLPDMERPK